MPFRKRVLFVLAIAIVFTAGAFTARGLQSPPIFNMPAFNPRQPAPPPAAQVISGADLGFRLEQSKGKTAIGTLMVRVNGQWLEAESAAKYKTVPLGER
jgi:hypothetical protein